MARKRRLRLSVQANVRYPGGHHVRNRTVTLKAPRG
jgi:hypothetical protein